MKTSNALVNTLLGVLDPEKRDSLINQLQERLDALNQEKEDILEILTLVRQQPTAEVVPAARPASSNPGPVAEVVSAHRPTAHKHEAVGEEPKKRKRRTGIKQRFWPDIKTYIFEELQKAHRLMNCIDLTHLVAQRYGITSPRMTQEKKLLLKSVTNYSYRMATGASDTPIVLERVKMMEEGDKQKIWYYTVK